MPWCLFVICMSDRPLKLSNFAKKKSTFISFENEYNIKFFRIKCLKTSKNRGSGRFPPNSKNGKGKEKLYIYCLHYS